MKEGLVEEGCGLYLTAQKWEYLGHGKPVFMQLVMLQCLKPTWVAIGLRPGGMLLGIVVLITGGTPP